MKLPAKYLGLLKEAEICSNQNEDLRLSADLNEQIEDDEDDEFDGIFSRCQSDSFWGQTEKVFLKGFRFIKSDVTHVSKYICDAYHIKCI